MRIRKKAVLSALFCLAAVMLTGCGKKTADDYVKEQLELVQAGDDATVEMLLDAGIEKANEKYICEFPEELREPYCEFLKAACSRIQFEIVETSKYNSGYKVRVELTPVDVSKTVEDTDDEYVKNLQSADLTAEVLGLLEKDTALLSQAKADKKEKITFHIKKKDSGYQIESSEWEMCLNSLLSGYMDPYMDVAEIIDAGDYLKAFLDAGYKGEVAQYAKHVGMTEEDCIQQYDAIFGSLDLAEMEMSSEQEARAVAALKEMFQKCQYEVGVPRKNETDGYRIEVTVTPNLSLQQSMAAFETDVNNGKYGTWEQAKEGFVTTLEAYAASPVYGEQTTTEVNISLGILMFTGDGSTDLDRLGDLLIPSAE